MRHAFYALCDFAKKKLDGGEEFTAEFAGEDSDFCRINQAKVRQAGSVEQRSLTLRLIRGQKNASGTTTLAGVKAEDEARVSALIKTLRDQLKELPDDPHLLYSTEVVSTESIVASKLEDPREVVQKVLTRCQSLDMVGIFASGMINRGFGNSLGQRNWYERASFNLDWSFYLRADKAVKSGYAGFVWDDDVFRLKAEVAKSQLSVLERPAKKLSPGQYRVYLAPTALNEITDMMGWGGFSMKALRTKQTPLIKMVEAGETLHPSVTVAENTKDGIAPNFNSSGYLKPDSVRLIDQGRYNESLISPRTAKEYGLATNGADRESPESLDFAAGVLPLHRIEAEIGDGVYINNLWYLNFSDRQNARITGMTRFASFWVERGQIAAPIDVMRFDDSILKLLGDKLAGLTAEREMLLSASTYGGRATGSARLPGALIDGFTFTL